MIDAVDARSNGVDQRLNEVEGDPLLPSATPPTAAPPGSNRHAAAGAPTMLTKDPPAGVSEPGPRASLKRFIEASILGDGSQTRDTPDRLQSEQVTTREQPERLLADSTAEAALISDAVLWLGRSSSASGAGPVHHAMSSRQLANGAQSSTGALVPGVSAGQAAIPPEDIDTPAAPKASFRSPLKTQDFRLHSSAVHVALVSLNEGLRVSARVANMGATERTRLKERVAALLAEYGLTGSISLASNTNSFNEVQRASK